MVGHTSKRDTACDICGKLFMSLTHLKAHNLLHTEPKFCCSFDGCSRKFFVRSALETHKKTHIEQRDFACDLCDKKYFKNNHLQRHIINFHKRLKFTCELPGCSSLTFVRKESYRSHVLKHHKELSEEKKHFLLMKIRDMKLV